MFLGKVQLEDNFAAPSKTWGQAWSDLAVASDDLQDYVDNSNASIVARREAYDRQIKTIHDRTGVQMQNPYIEARKAPMAAVREQMQGKGLLDRFGILADQARADRGRTVQDVIADPREAAIADFNKQLGDLAVRFPDHADLFDPEIGADFGAVSRAADAAFEEAYTADELGLFGRLTATLAGGVTGSMKDPLQLGLLFVGAGAGTAKTVAGRIAQVAFREAAINAGAEIPLQLINQNYRREVGLDYGLGDAARNVAAAGVLGGAFGGGVQGIGEIVRALRGVDVDLPDAALVDMEAPIARLVNGDVQPGDIEVLEALTGKPIAPEQKRLLERSFEEDVLDNAMVPDDLADGDPARMAVLEAAIRYADDPDNNLPPEIVEQMLAEQQAGRVFDDVDDFVRSQPDMIPDDPLADQTLAPRVVDDIADTFDDVPEFVEPELDASGNYADMTQLVPTEDRYGNPIVVSERQAFDMANEDDFLADLMEACAL